jgi:hypothetical protein
MLPDYPPILTAHDWDQHKGWIAKVKTRNNPTGITDQLKLLEKLYKQLKDSVEMAAGIKNLAMFERNESGNLKSLQNGLDHFQTLAKDAHDRFKESMVVPKKVAEHVDNMMQAATIFGDRCTAAFKKALQELRAEVKGEEAEEEAGEAQDEALAQLVKKVQLGIAKAMLEGTAASLRDNVGTPAEQLARALDQHHAHKALARNWHLIAGYKLTPEDADAQTVKTRAQTANAELQKVKAALG